MPDTGFSRPTLAELVDRISTDLNTRLPGRDSRIRRSVLWVLARVYAGAVHLLHGFAAWIARQILPDTADGDRLRRHAAIWGLSPTPPAKAEGPLEFVGVAASTVPAGAIAQRGDGAEFELLAELLIGAGGTGTVTVRALKAGLAGNCDVGTILELVSPVAGVTSAATSGAIVGGLDAETVEELRLRLLDRIRSRPQGGALLDYIAWTREIAGVDRVFVVPRELGPGTVTVRFTVRGQAAAVIPNAGKVAEVQAHLDELAPVTAAPTAMAPIGLPVDLTIKLSPDTPAIRSAVVAELDLMFALEGQPGGTIPNSHLREAIARAPGELSHRLTAVAGGAGTDDVVQGPTEIAHLGAITWI